MEPFTDFARRFCDPSTLRAPVAAADDLYTQIAELRDKVEGMREAIDRLKQENAKLKAQREVLMELARR